MRRILFIGPVELENPIRGTPLRIYNFLKQVDKGNILFVSAINVPSEWENKFIAYSKKGGFSKVKYFREVVKRERIDTVVTATETGMRLPIILKFLTGVKIAIDIHGLYAEEMYLAGKIGKVKKNVFGIKTRLMLLPYDLVFVVSNKLKKYYRGWNHNIVVLWGGVNAGDYPPAPESFPAQLTVGYMGNARAYQGLDFLLRALGNIKEKNSFPFRLNLIVSGDFEDVVDKLKNLDLLERTDLHNNVPHSQVHSIISHSSVLVIPRPSIPVTEYAYPSKLPEDLMTGIPTIMTNVGPVEELLGGRNISIVIPATNISTHLEEVLLRVNKMTETERINLGQRARSFVAENLSWDKLGGVITGALSKLE